MIFLAFTFGLLLGAGLMLGLQVAAVFSFLRLEKVRLKKRSIAAHD